MGGLGVQDAGQRGAGAYGVKKGHRAHGHSLTGFRVPGGGARLREDKGQEGNRGKGFGCPETYSRRGGDRETRGKPGNDGHTQHWFQPPAVRFGDTKEAHGEWNQTLPTLLCSYQITEPLVCTTIHIQ